MRLADEVGYIQRRAAVRDGRIGGLVLFSGRVTTILGYPTDKLAQAR